MLRVEADRDSCQGYANCVVAASDVFDIDDDGLVVVLRADVDQSERQRVANAAQSCPVRALTVVDQ